MQFAKIPGLTGAVLGALIVPVWFLKIFALILICFENAVCGFFIEKLVALNPYVFYLRLRGWRFSEELPPVAPEFFLDDVSMAEVFVVNMVIFALLGAGLDVLLRYLSKHKKKA